MVKTHFLPKIVARSSFVVKNYEKIIVDSHYKFDICFWTENAKDHDYIRDNFLNRIRNYDDKVDNDIANKITVRYLLNRNVGAIDNR